MIPSNFDSFGSVMRGMGAAREQQNERRRQQMEEEERQYRESERAYQAQRRAIEDPLKDEEYGLRVAAARNKYGWQEEDRPIQRQMLENQAETSGINLESSRFNRSRQPIEARQADERHRSVMSAQAQQRYTNDIRTRMAELGLDEAEFVAEHTRFRRGASQALNALRMKDDVTPLNNLMLSLNGGRGSLVQKNGDDHYVIVDPSGRQQKVGGKDALTFEELTGLVNQITQPEGFLGLYGQLRGSAASGAPPAAVQEIEYYASRLPRQEGESESDHWQRAMGIRNRAKSRPEQERFETLVSNLMSSGDARSVEEAAQKARAIMSQSFRQGSPGAGSSGDGDGDGSGGPGSSQDNPVRLSSREDANGLPRGTWVMTPNGKIGQVP